MQTVSGSDQGRISPMVHSSHSQVCSCWKKNSVSILDYYSHYLKIARLDNTITKHVTTHYKIYLCLMWSGLTMDYNLMGSSTLPKNMGLQILPLAQDIHSAMDL